MWSAACRSRSPIERFVTPVWCGREPSTASAAFLSGRHQQPELPHARPTKPAPGGSRSLARPSTARCKAQRSTSSSATSSPSASGEPNPPRPGARAGRQIHERIRQQLGARRRQAPRRHQLSRHRTEVPRRRHRTHHRRRRPRLSLGNFRQTISRSRSRQRHASAARPWPRRKILPRLPQRASMATTPNSFSRLIPAPIRSREQRLDPARHHHRQPVELPRLRHLRPRPRKMSRPHPRPERLLVRLAQLPSRHHGLQALGKLLK